MDFAGKIMSWYNTNKRDLPWRSTRDPYKIWLSEVILQQTRVNQGIAYYHAFTEKYPTVHALARAPEGDVMKLWQGLGYYSRARNLHATAKRVVSEYNGEFPAGYEELLQLKGIGDYTAAAISSICHGEAKAVVDGNVYRVLSRIFGIATPIDSTAGKKIFRELATSLLDKKDPATFNQAVMEFGARQCVPKNPQCEICPFVLFCAARKKNLIDQLPCKEKKTKVTDRFFYYFIFSDQKKIVLKKRTENDIWKNMYDFPLIQTKKRCRAKNIIASPEFKKLTGQKKMVPTKISEETKHVLSHQRLHIRFIEMEMGKITLCKNWIYVNEKQLKKYALPVPVARYFAKKLFTR